MSQRKRILVLAPHTDDGEFGCGGTITRFVEEGDDVYYAAFSTAEKSVPPKFPANILEREVRLGTCVLGIRPENLLVYKYEVRCLPQARQEILEELVRLKAEINPDTIFIPSSQDLHQDHQTVYTEGLRAFKMVDGSGIRIALEQPQFRLSALRGTSTTARGNQDRSAAVLPISSP
jgi:LmbE family N-acetylglucosaminyl deacetylase